MVFGATTNGTSTGASSLTFTSPTVSGTLTLGVVGVLVQTDLTITGVTWNGTAMTFISRSTNGANSERVELWHIVNPSAGATNVVISRTGSSNALIGIASFYNSTRQTAQPDSSTSNTQTTGTYSPTTTTVADRSTIIMMSRGISGSTFTAGASTTIRSQPSTGQALSERANVTPAGSTAINLTCTSQEIISAIASFAPFIDSVTVTDTSSSSDTILQSVTQIVTDTVTTTEDPLNTIEKWVNAKKNPSDWNNAQKS